MPSHAPIPGSNRVPLEGARVVGRTNPHTLLEVTLKLRRKKALPELTSRPARAMTRDEMARTYGASPADVAKVVSTFKAFGLQVADTNAATRTVRLRGSAEAMENAFGVRLFNYEHSSGHYRGRVGPVQVPNAVKDVVVAAFGLDNRRVARRRGQPVHGRPRIALASAIPPSWYTPARLAKHYKFPEGDGAGQTVAILEFGGGYFESDLQQFCTLAGTSLPQVKAVSVDGTPTDSDDDAAGEVMLDVEIVAGACPKSRIVLYFATFSEHGWVRALDAVTQDTANDPRVVSVSWGWAEGQDVWTPQAMTQVDEALKEAAHLGITVCIAAGDDGSSDGIRDGHAHADFPASSPYALAIGGTTITSKGRDIVWKEGDGLREDNGGSTGGGVSDVFDRPAWQSKVTIASVNPTGKAGRCLPDVAANADWDASPYLLVVDNKAQPNGGTSAATPLWASLITLINAELGKQVGYLNPLLYQAAGAGKTIGSLSCNDIKSGDNSTDPLGGYRAQSGYDAVTGWGTPNGEKLLAALAKVL